MKKTRKAHLWIGLICSILILMESITGLLMNEPWLIGQSQGAGRGDFQPAQVIQGGSSNVTSPQNQGQTSGQNQPNSQNQTNSQNQSNSQGQNETVNITNGQFPGAGGFGGAAEPVGDGGGSSGSFMSIIKGLHAGRIGTTDIKWLTDLAALAMIFLTASGIFLSIKFLRADKKRKERKTDKAIVVEGY